MPKPVPKPVPISDIASWKQSESTYIVGRAHVDGVDALAIDLERKWGCDRLRLLVDVELRARFDAQRVKFNRALTYGELEDVKRESLRMQNAWRALDARAEDTDQSKLNPLVWEVVLPSGKVAAIVRSNADAFYVSTCSRKVDVFTLDEIANLIHGFPEIVKVKATFPGAEVVRVGPIVDPLQDLDDEIPW